MKLFKGVIKFIKFDHRFGDIYKYIYIERYREKCSSSLSDFSENVAREIERVSVCTTVDANHAGPEMSTLTKLLDNRDQRVKWKIFEDRDTSMPELTFLCIEASPVCDPNLGTRLTHFRCQSRASSPLRELHRADRSIFVRAFVRDGNMTKWFHLDKFVSSCRKRHNRIFAVSERLAMTSK